MLLFDLLILTHHLANGATVVLAPDPAASLVAIHATFATSEMNPAVASRLEGWTADANEQRAVLAIETDDAPRALRQLGDALSQQPVDDRYTAPSAVIAIVGNVDKSILESIKIPNGPPRARCITQVSEPPIRVTRSDIDVSITYRTAVAPSADWFALNILADILGQGDASRLQRALVASGLAARFGEGMTESPCVPSLLRMRAHLAPGVSADRVLKVIDRENERLQRELVSDEELRVAHEQERRFADDQFASPAAVASAVARSALFYGDARRVTSDGARMQRVTAEDVRRVARRYLTKARNAGVPAGVPHSDRKT